MLRTLLIKKLAVQRLRPVTELIGEYELTQEEAALLRRLRNKGG